ncbi:NBR1-Ig-like domain-containing protein [Plantactinospora sp. CA-294935]|uniref:NBR1-Ig-like domain-containing protein n=1 Tax=Plantactinospora sp. CA-294935 TaxID=3240012 RepID=UPI003D89C511
MAAVSRSISHTTLHEAASGTRFPSWETTREFVRACHGNETAWRAKWESARPAGSGPSAAAGSGPSAAGEAGSVPLTRRSPAVAAWGRRLGPGWGRPGSARLGGAVTLGALALVGTLLAVALLVAARPDRERSGAPIGAASAGTATTAPAGVPTGPLVDGDRSRFITDVTVPDGTRVRVGETFVKVWEIQNAGTVPWRNRYLQREDVPAQPGSCRSPERIPIRDTLPNERVEVSVTVIAPSAPTTCMVRWKMVDEHGRQLFPTARPVFFLVHVDATTGTPGPL